MQLEEQWESFIAAGFGKEEGAKEKWIEVHSGKRRKAAA
jgi:hypothetical protein